MGRCSCQGLSHPGRVTGGVLGWHTQTLGFLKFLFPGTSTLPTVWITLMRREFLQRKITQYDFRLEKPYGKKSNSRTSA